MLFKLYNKNVTLSISNEQKNTMKGGGDAVREDKNYPTIRQTARRGPLSEAQLRIMQHQGRLPGFFVGSHFRVNYAALLEQLERQSLVSVSEREARSDSKVVG